MVYLVSHQVRQRSTGSGHPDVEVFQLLFSNKAMRDRFGERRVFHQRKRPHALSLQQPKKRALARLLAAKRSQYLQLG